MTVASAERLHVLAHRSAVAERDFEDWWGSPLQTAMASIALARHSNAHRGDAERALERLLRWVRDETPRSISGDVAALALGARAASELQRRAPALTKAAIDGIEQVCRRGRSVPRLHLALWVWALDTLEEDRSAEPWPAIREHLEESRHGGVDEPLERYALATARPAFDASALIQDLLSTIGSAPGLSESCILLWLMAVAAEKLAPSLPPSDSALQVLLRRRAELVDRLAEEIDERTFVEPDVPEFGSDHDEPVVGLPPYLTTFEALLLDVALASREEIRPWLTFPEADALFGQAAREARGHLATVRRRLLRWVGLLAGVLGISIAVAVWLALRRAGVDTGVANGATVTVAAPFAAVGVSLSGRGREDAQLIEPLGGFFALLALLACVVTLNEALKKPFLPSQSGLIVSTLLAAVAALAWKLIQTTVGRRKE